MIGLKPDGTEARVVRNDALALTFADGLHGEVVVLDRMRGPVFDQARTAEGFAEVRVDRETGKPRLDDRRAIGSRRKQKSAPGAERRFLLVARRRLGLAH